MVPSRCVKSEYMKRFKEPKWEACGPCYQELLRYRLSRRLLEQAHRPWFWDGWEPDSGGGGGGSSSSRGSSGSSGSAPSPTASPAAVAAQPLQQEEEEEGNAGPEEEEQEKTEADRTSAAKITDKSTGQQQGPPASRSAVGARGDRRRAKSPQRTETTKELRHPFALYGWGEKQTDTGNQKTHNVCASASQNEIHESALRAKNRRQVEKRKMPQRQIRSADVEKTWRMKSSGADNPWMTEYMRCYSARTR
ncbi:centriole, cilia and spindle-associated protein isoform X1 [Anolis carolinensis]|uniref:centriole, cilia and spindle-associated protein isoform X1 n=1 Tax=Anolis carolinensis TaxID=28377 RepID=UPI002F2B637C